MADTRRHKDFEELDFEAQRKLVAESAFSEKIELIFKTHYPEKIIESISHEELYLIYRNTEDELLPDLLNCASVDQLLFMSDIECWDIDRINPERFLWWLDRLINAGIEKLYEWLVNTDFEMIVSGFKQHIEVLKAPTEEMIDDFIGDRPYFSIDTFYYMICNDENADILQRSIEVIFAEAKELYLNLMEALLSEIDSEIEENAYQLKQERMSEIGFPDSEVAHRIYKRITLDDLENSEEKETAPRETEDEKDLVINYPKQWHKDHLFLDDVLTLMAAHRSEVVSHLQIEIMGIVNKVIVCRGVERFDENTIRECIERVRYSINIGIEKLSGRDLAKAEVCVRRYWLEDLFRFGFTQTLELRDWAWGLFDPFMKKRAAAFIQFIDEPYNAYVKGLFQSHPKFYDPAMTEDIDFLRDFKKLEEIEHTRKILIEIFDVVMCLHDQAAFDISKLYSLDSYTDPEDIRLSAVMTTFFAIHTMRESLKHFRLLYRNEVAGFLEAATETKNEIRSVGEEAVRDFFASIHYEKNTNSYMDYIFTKLDQDVAYIRSPDDVEPRFFPSLLIRK